MPKTVVDADIFKAQHTHGNAALLIVANSDEIAVCVTYAHHVTLADVALSMVDGAAEYPRMIAQQALFLTSFQDDLLHFPLL